MGILKADHVFGKPHIYWGEFAGLVEQRPEAGNNFKESINRIINEVYIPGLISKKNNGELPLEKYLKLSLSSQRKSSGIGSLPQKMEKAGIENLIIEDYLEPQWNREKRGFSVTR